MISRNHGVSQTTLAFNTLGHFQATHTYYYTADNKMSPCNFKKHRNASDDLSVSAILNLEYNKGLGRLLPVTRARETFHLHLSVSYTDYYQYYIRSLYQFWATF